MWDRHLAGPFRMLEVVVITGRADENPPILFQEPDELSAIRFHLHDGVS
jgi:hypothetical protein